MRHAACLEHRAGCPATVATPTTSTAAGFVSPRYGYALTLPEAWETSPIGTSVWGGGSILGPDFPGTDVHQDGGEGYNLFIAAADVRPDTTLEGWTQLQAEVTDRQSSCHGTPDVERLSLDGEPADLSVLDRSDCDNDHHVLEVTALHAERGWVVVWLAPPGADDAKRPLFEEILSSFRFPA
jgi:hypothetical protein